MKTINGFKPQFFDAEELNKSFIDEYIKLRKSYRCSQKKVGAVCGIAQPVIARIENLSSNPRLLTIIKLLSVFGKELAIVDIENK